MSCGLWAVGCEYDQTGAQEIREEAMWITDNIGRLRYRGQSEPMYERAFADLLFPISSDESGQSAMTSRSL